MIQPNSFEFQLQKALKMQVEGAAIEKIRSQLALDGIEAATLELVVEAVKKLTLEKRRKRGIKLGLVAVILLITGFILTVIFYHSGVAIHYVMYGMTSLGAILLLIAMIDLLGW